MKVMEKKGNKKESLILKLPLIISLCTALFSFSVLTIYPIWTKYIHNGSILGTIQELKHIKKEEELKIRWTMEVRKKRVKS